MLGALLKKDFSGCREVLDRDGYVLLPEAVDISALRSITAEIELLGQEFIPEFSFNQALGYVGQLPDSEREALYGSLRYLRSLYQFACEPALADLSQQLGLKFPAIMKSTNIRMDLPGEQRFLFHWHQDTAYLLGSLNALTYWIPLQDCVDGIGGIDVIPGSHLCGLLPFDFCGEQSPMSNRPISPKELRLKQEPREEHAVAITAKQGDVVVFYQTLLHRSRANTSDQIRWTMQVRHSDFSDVSHREHGYPMGDATNIFMAPELYVGP